MIATVDAANRVSRKTLLRAGAVLVERRPKDGGATLVFEWRPPHEGIR